MIDLTVPGSHDGDVGLPDYEGWMATYAGITATPGTGAVTVPAGRASSSGRPRRGRLRTY